MKLIIVRQLIPVCLLLFSVAAQINAQPAHLQENLVLHLPLTEDLKDHSAAKHPIQVVGNVKLEQEGAYFGGRKDWLEAPHIALNDRAFSIALWIKPTTGDRQIGLFEQFDLNRPGHHFCLLLRENRQPYLGFYARDLISPLSVGWEPEWFHVVFQYTGEFQQIWINGRLIGSLRSDSYNGESGISAIGKAPRWSNARFNDFVGFMRDFRIYHQTLTHQEIASLATPPDPAAAKARQVETSNQFAPPQPSSKLNGSLAQTLSSDTGIPFLEINGKRISINGRPGQIYILESTTDFQTWTPLARFANENGRAVYLDNREGEMRFYRVVGEPREP